MRDVLHSIRTTYIEDDPRTLKLYSVLGSYMNYFGSLGMGYFCLSDFLTNYKNYPLYMSEFKKRSHTKKMVDTLLDLTKDFKNIDLNFKNVNISKIDVISQTFNEVIKEDKIKIKDLELDDLFNKFSKSPSAQKTLENSLKHLEKNLTFAKKKQLVKSVNGDSIKDLSAVIKSQEYIHQELSNSFLDWLSKHGDYRITDIKAKLKKEQYSQFKKHQNSLRMTKMQKICLGTTGLTLTALGYTAAIGEDELKHIDTKAEIGTRTKAEDVFIVSGAAFTASCTAWLLANIAQRPENSLLHHFTSKKKIFTTKQDFKEMNDALDDSLKRYKNGERITYSVISNFESTTDATLVNTARTQSRGATKKREKIKNLKLSLDHTDSAEHSEKAIRAKIIKRIKHKFRMKGLCL